MTCWEFLKINPTIDTKEIKHAYAKLLQQYHPEDDPQAFQKLREAFEEALKESKFLDSETLAQTSQLQTDRQDAVDKRDENDLEEKIAEDGAAMASDQHGSDPATEVTPETMVQQYMEDIAGLYADFSKRKDMNQWENALAHLLMWPIDAKLLLSFHLFGFLGQNPWVPPLVWALANEHFSWHDRQAELYQHFPEEMVEGIFWRINNHPWALKYDHIPVAADVDYDTYLYHRECIGNAIVQGQMDKAKEHLEQAFALIKGDSELQRLSLAVHLNADDNEAALSSSELLIEDHPDHLEGHLHRAYLLLSKNDSYKAISAFQDVLRISPDHLSGLTGLACCHIAIDNLFEAQKLLEQALEQCPDHVEASVELIRTCHMLTEKLLPELKNKNTGTRIPMRLAEAYFKTGMYSQAHDIINDYLSDVRDSDVHLLWARVLTKLDKPKDALRQFNRAQEAAKLNGENQYNVLKYRGVFYYDQEAYEPAITDLEQAKGIISPLMDKRVWFYLAEAYMWLDANEKAIELTDALINIDNGEAKYFLCRAHAYFDDKKYESALKDFNMALQRDYYCGCRINICSCLVKLKKHDQALEALDEAESFNRGSGQIPYYRARCAFECDELDKARTLIEESLEIDPDNIRSHQLAGFIYRASGEKDLAMECFKQYMHAEDTSPYYGLYAVNYGIEINRPKDSIACLELILETNEDPWVLLALTDILLATGKWKRALYYIERYFTSAEEQNSEIDETAYYFRGKVKYVYHTTRPKESLPDLHKACELDAGDMAFFYLSLAYFDMRDIDNAEKYARLALERDPDNPDFLKVVESIERYKGFGWLKRSLINSKAISLFEPTRVEHLYFIGPFPEFDESSATI